MNFLSLLSIAAGLASNVITQDQPAHTESKTNVILIMVDDMGYECLGCNGGLSYDTPHLDQMAEQGKRFTHCYSTPLSSPSRVKIMTGMYNYRNYEDFGYLSPEEKTFGDVMKQAGYATGIVGKWQLNGIGEYPGWQNSDRPKAFGFDEYCLWQVTQKPVRNEDTVLYERYADPYIEQNGKILKGVEDSYGPDIFSDYALDFMEKNKDQPFFLYYSMVLPHFPFVPTPASDEWEDKEKRYKEDKRYFKDMVEYTDMLVGKVVQKVKELGIADNTLILFTSDNGTHRPLVSQTRRGPVRGGKAMTIDAGTHVPLIAYWPEHIKPGSVYDGLIGFSDFYPTLADVAGKNVESDGKSFLPLLRGDPYKERETVFVHYDPMHSDYINQFRGRFVRTKEYKLYQDGRFYHIPTDKREQDPISLKNVSWDSGEIRNPVSMEHVSWEVIQIRRKLQNILDQAPEWEEDR